MVASQTILPHIRGFIMSMFTLMQRKGPYARPRNINNNRFSNFVSDPMFHVLVHASNWEIKYPNPKIWILELHITWPNYITFNPLHKNQSLVKEPRTFVNNLVQIVFTSKKWPKNKLPPTSLIVTPPWGPY